jgi:tocopherol cyclase
VRSLYKIYHPEIFQGSLKDKTYFEGWYFKHVSADAGNAFAIIAGVSLSEDPHSFIQYIDGNTGKTSYYRYKLSDFIADRKKLEVRLGRSLFSRKAITLDLDNDELRITGEIRNINISPLPKKFLNPGIMGWYSFVPGMECNHGIVSTGHRIDGQVSVNSHVSGYDGGKGYIEKDWGISFPEAWIWLQCNNFKTDNVSVMISIAKIPWRRSFFIGFISFISINGRTEILATYNRAKVIKLSRLDSNKTEIIIKKDSLNLLVVITKQGAGTLKAPIKGLMSSVIKESLNSEVFLELKKGDKLIFSGTGVRTGYEETDRIFDYF